MIRHVLMYKLKNVQNIVDIAEICRLVGASPWLVPREDSVLELPSNINVVHSLERAVECVGRDLTYLVLETYGDRFLSELPDEVFLGETCLVVGAEDFGFPESEVSKLPRAYVAKIPVGVQGASYNVVSSLVMALEEARLRALKMMRVS